MLSISGLSPFCLIEFEDSDSVAGGGCSWLFKRSTFSSDTIVSWWTSVIKDPASDLEYSCSVFVISVSDFDDSEDCVEDSLSLEDSETFFSENCPCSSSDKTPDLPADECDSSDEKDEADLLSDGDRKTLGDPSTCDSCCSVVSGTADFVVADDTERRSSDIGGGGGWELGLSKDFFRLNFTSSVFSESEPEICTDGKASGEMRETGGGGGGAGRDPRCCCNSLFDFRLFTDTE